MICGIWKKDVAPAWGSKWTTNINREMNYWATEVTNLSECHTPLFDLMDDLMVTGAKVASDYYGCRGWGLHHNADLWRGAAPVDGVWGVWPMGAAWLARHPWEHYLFTQDKAFLKNRAWPQMQGAARFVLDFLTEAPVGSPVAGKLVTCPSHSPENAFRLSDGGVATLTYGATMDLQIIHDLLTDCINAMDVQSERCYPDPAFLSKVAFAAFAIQDSDYLDEMGGDSNKLSEPPNGTGPYMVKEWVRGDHITFEANSNFWGEASKTQTLIFRWSAEAAQRLVELRSGTVDGIFLPSADDYETISADPNLKLYPYETGNIFYIGLNNTIAPFDNDKVRQAVAMAINKQQIVDNYYPAGSAVAEQFVPPSFKPGFSTSGDGG